MGPTVPPAVRDSERVAFGRAHVATPFTVSVNLTGTTPRDALNTLEPSGLIGGSIVAKLGSGPMKLPKACGLAPTGTLATTVLVAVFTTETVPLPPFATYAKVPAGLTETPIG